MKLGVVAMVVGGCSFAIAKAPNSDPGVRPLECDTSKDLPIADTVGAVGFGLVAVSALVVSTDDGLNAKDPRDSTDQTTIIARFGAALLVPAIICTISAMSGYGSVERCRGYNATSTTKAVKGKEPATFQAATAKHEACEKVRVESLERALAIHDLPERGRALSRVPACGAQPVLPPLIK